MKHYQEIKNMTVALETPSFLVLPLDQIVSKLPVRRLSLSGLRRIQDSMQKVGFLENYPIVVAPLEDGTYLLIDGNHRYESASALGLASVPCLVKHGLPEDEMYRLALQSNSASVTSVPMTMVAYAEFIWARLAEKDERDKKRYTQLGLAKILGWTDSAVSNYALLDKIDKQAWEIISTTFDSSETKPSQDTVGENSTNVGIFTEGLLRNLLDLTREQQKELVKERANDPKTFTSGKFTTLAKAYQTRNTIKDYALTQLGDLGEPFTTQLLDNVSSGAYDKDWTDNPEHPKLQKLIKSIRDEWQRLNMLLFVYAFRCANLSV